jgi:2'-5' RNA ligase
VPTQTESQELHGLINNIQRSIERANNTRRKPLPVPDITPSLRSPLGAPLPLHVSLSRTLQIKTDDREAFVETLNLSLRKVAVRPFCVRFSRLKWVPNFERNRWFLVLGIEKPAQDELNRLLEACNEAAEKCGYPGLYTGGIGDGPTEDNTTSTNSGKRMKSTHEGFGDKVERPACVDYTGNFHVSIAWNLVEPNPEWMTLVQSIDVADYAGLAMTSFDAVKAKVGNMVNNIELGNHSAHLGIKGGLLGV